MQLCFCDVILTFYFIIFSILFSHFTTYGNCACFKMNHKIIQFCADLRMLDSNNLIYQNVRFETTLELTDFHYMDKPPLIFLKTSLLWKKGIHPGVEWNGGVNDGRIYIDYPFTNYPITFYDVKFAFNVLIFTRQAHISKAVVRL